MSDVPSPTADATAVTSLELSELTEAPPTVDASPVVPAVVDPPADEPVVVEPIAAEPIAAEPVPVEPVAAEPVAAEPVPVEPVREEPASTATPGELEDHLAPDLRLAFTSGTPVTGKVIGWNQGGFHVAIGETAAFCPRSEMEVGHAHEPARYLDQEYEFRIQRVEDAGRRVVLSRAALVREERKRQAESTRQSLEVGAVRTGRIRSLTDFGAFVDLGGVEGLVHVSEISRQRVQNPAEVLKVGQEVQVKVLKIGSQGSRISLSIKALEPDPWEAVGERYKAGEPFSGKVLRKAEFGLFVELEPQIEGLIHVSQLPIGKDASDPSLAPGESISGWIREVDPSRRRISLAMREVAVGDPWKEAAGKYPEGAMVEGTVEKIAQFGVFIELEPGVTALLPGSETGLPRGASLGKAYPTGKKVRLQVASVDLKRRRISLALEGKTLEGSRADYQAYLKKSREISARGLGPMAAALRKMREH
jgi:small subunit ribosomal protein S1